VAPPPPPLPLPPQSHAFSAAIVGKQDPRYHPKHLRRRGLRQNQNQAVDVGAANRFGRNALGNTQLVADAQAQARMPSPLSAPAAGLDVAAAAVATDEGGVLPGFLQTKTKLQVSRVVDHVLMLNSSNLEPRMTVQYLSAIVHDVLSELHVRGSKAVLEKHSISIAQHTLGVLRRVSDA
jgi:hypothetical protein